MNDNLNNKSVSGTSRADEHTKATERAYDMLRDEKSFRLAVELALVLGSVSSSILQRRLRISYDKAAQYIDCMQALSIITPKNAAAGKYEVLITPEKWQQICSQNGVDTDTPCTDCANATQELCDEVELASDMLGDESFIHAVELALKLGSVSASILQRRLQIGYAKASKYIDCMQTLSIIGAQNGQAARQVLITAEKWKEILELVNG